MALGAALLVAGPSAQQARPRPDTGEAGRQPPAFRVDVSARTSCSLRDTSTGAARSQPPR